VTPVEDEQPTSKGGSRVAGGCVLFVLGGWCVTALFALAPDVARLAFWAGAAVWLWWAVDDSRRSVRDTDNPAPPPPSEGAAEEKPQFTVVDDPNNPHHSVVVWNDKKEQS
jgi:threonine/homoserine/homoserine lactone efflux protein